MSYPRLAIFFALTIVGSLLQLWVVIVLQEMFGRTIDFVEIFSDGSLFFFSTTLVFGSWFSLLTSDRDQTSQSASVAISIICVGLVTVLSAVIYSVATSETLQKKALPFPASNYLVAQLACATVAVVYTLYASAILGVFDKPAATRSPAVTEHV